MAQPSLKPTRKLIHQIEMRARRDRQSSRTPSQNFYWSPPMRDGYYKPNVVKSRRV